MIKRIFVYFIMAVLLAVNLYAAEPASLPKWDENATNTLPISTELQDDGFALKTRPASGTFNSWMRNVYKWTEWFQEKFAGVDSDIAKLQPVDSIAALRAITYTPEDGQIVNVSGYYSPGDGGGGQFYWVATNIDADNNGTIIKITAITTGRWVRLVEGEELYADWFGAYSDGTHATETTTGINEACAALTNPGVVRLSKGTYLHNGTILLGDGNHLRGEGFNATNLTTSDNIIQLKITGFWSEVTGISFTKTGTSTVENIYNLGFGVEFRRNFVQVPDNQTAGGYVESDATAYALAVASGNSGMVDTTDSGQGVQSVQDNIFSQCYMWLTSSDSQYLNNDVWASSDTIGSSQLPFAIKVQNMSAWLIQGCDIINGAPSNTALGYGGGIVIHNAFLGRIYDNYFNPNDKIPGQSAPDTMHHISASHSTGLLDIKIRGNTFRHSYRQGIYTTRMNRCQITNNLFFHGNVADNAYADIDVGGVGSVSGNIISGNTFDNSLTLVNPGLAINIQSPDTFRGNITSNTVDGSYLLPYITWDELGSQSGACGGNVYQGLEEKRNGIAVINATGTTITVTFANALIHPPSPAFLNIVQTAPTGSGTPFKIDNFTANGFTIDQVADSTANYSYYYNYKYE